MFKWWLIFFNFCNDVLFDFNKIDKFVCSVLGIGIKLFVINFVLFLKFIKVKFMLLRFVLDIMFKYNFIFIFF